MPICAAPHLGGSRTLDLRSSLVEESLLTLGIGVLGATVELDSTAEILGRDLFLGPRGLGLRAQGSMGLSAPCARSTCVCVPTLAHLVRVYSED